MTLSLPDRLRGEISAHAREGTPEEVVGVLAGRHDEERSITERLYRAENAADRPRVRYEIRPQEELEILETIDSNGRDVVGFYHSHPQGPLSPSGTDAALAAWPGYSYLIVSLADGAEIGSWRWSGERFEREPIE